jgi:hypothetical protein
VEWVVAVGAFFVVSVLVIGVPMYLAVTRWSSHRDRAARRARAAPAPAIPAPRAARRTSSRRRRRAFSP